MKDEPDDAASLWVIGLDPDGTLFLQLTWSLRRVGAKMSADWDPGDLAKFPLECPDGQLFIDAETSEGLVVFGPPVLITRLRHAFESMTSRSTS